MKVKVLTENDVTTQIDTSSDVPTSEAVKNYVDAQIQAEITNVLNASY